MAIAFVNRTDVKGSTSPLAATAANHTTGNLLWVFVLTQNANAVTVSDTAGNTFTQIGVTITSGINRLRQYYAKNITGHATNVVTATYAGATAYSVLGVRQFSGCDTSSPLNGSNTGTGASGTAIATGTITIVGSNSVICAGIEADGQPITAGSGYAITAITGGGGFTADEYKLVSASEAATATGNASNVWAIVGAAFNAAGAAAAGVFGQSGLDGLSITGPKQFNPSLS
jgi:hypothetical protein